MFTHLLSHFTALMAVAVASLAVSTSQAAELGLDGYCAVCVVKMSKWEVGNPAITSSYDDTTYRFPSAGIQAKFDADPAAFVPALGGDCVVCMTKMGKRVPGSVQHSSLYKERLYLFPSDAEKAMFEASPERFVDVDLAMNGNCAVCAAKMGKMVPGDPDHTVVHDGMRYQFPSAKEAAMFAASPARFVLMVSAKQPVRRMASPASTTVSFTGRAGCAACEHGVHPIGSPSELGYAINTADGRVVIVEGVHEADRAAYDARFDGGPATVVGEVIKTQGKFTWVRPVALDVK